MPIKIPKNEIAWTDYYDSKGNLRFIITSTQMRDSYILYEIGEPGVSKVGKARTPVELENKFDILSKIK